MVDITGLENAVNEACKKIDDLRAANQLLRHALEEVRELIDGYVDVKDGDNGPVANNAMRAVQLIDEAL